MNKKKKNLKIKKRTPCPTAVRPTGRDIRDLFQIRTSNVFNRTRETVIDVCVCVRFTETIVVAVHALLFLHTE